MAADFTIKQGDTAPAIAGTLKQSGEARNLTGATVRFHMRRKGQTDSVVDASATVVDAADGQVEYEWQAGDTDVIGTYEAEWEVTLSGGGIETYPSEEYVIVEVLADVD